MTLENLINFIDFYTDNGTISPHKPWGEEISIKENGVNLVRSLRANDWLALYQKLGKKSDFWIECLIDLLDLVGTRKARQMIVHIALNGTEKNFFDGMKCIGEFRRDVDVYTWLKLKNRASEISKHS